MKFSQLSFAIFTLGWGIVLPSMAQTEPPAIKFHEVYDLVRSNLTDVTEGYLDRMAAIGLIKELGPVVQLVKDGEETKPHPIKSTVYNDTFAFIRLDQIHSSTPEAFNTAFNNLSSSNRLRGLVLDLRYATGADYNAAAKVADRFIKKDEPLLKWGETTVRSTAKTNAIEIPVAILVNQQTSGAAEALTALLRENESGLVIGSSTAGQTRAFETFTLSTGQQIRIGTTPVQLANGKSLSVKGIVPDLAVTVEPTNEKTWYEDPYKSISRVFREASTNDTASLGAPGRLSRRLNEAELVRRHREGTDSDIDPHPADEPAKQVVLDPVLARGLDFLKGWAVLQGLH